MGTAQPIHADRGIKIRPAQTGRFTCTPSQVYVTLALRHRDALPKTVVTNLGYLPAGGRMASWPAAAHGHVSNSPQTDITRASDASGNMQDKPPPLPLFGQEPMRAGYWVFGILIPDRVVDRLMLWGSALIAIGCLIYLAFE